MPGFNSGLGFGYGFSALIWIIAIIIVGGIVWRGRKNYVLGTPAVLKRFHVNEDPSAFVGVEIVGRASGIVSWVLVLLGLDSEVNFIVTNSEVTIRSASLSGIQHICVPLRKITATVCGYQRSILALGFTILFGIGFVMNLLSGFVEGNRNELGSDMGLAFGYLIFAGIAGLVYFLSKRIAISVETMHSHPVVFKRSVIENVSVDLPEALRAISVINARLHAAQAMQLLTDQSANPASPKRVPESPTVAQSQSCPQCSNVNPTGTRFCENCGSSLSR